MTTSSVKLLTKYFGNFMTRQLVSYIMAICIGLNLPKNYSMYLLEICSYTLGSSPRDRAYKFCLDFDDKTIDDWNIILEAFGQPRIPYTRNQKIA